MKLGLIFGGHEGMIFGDRWIRFQYGGESSVFGCMYMFHF